MGCMAKDGRKRLNFTLNFDDDPIFFDELDREAEAHAKRSGFVKSLNAYIKHLLKTHQRRTKVK